jgi:CheY-like chemotaxis protein
MPRVLISESHEDVRRLLVRMLTRLGHEPVVVRIAEPEQLLGADVLIVEPATPLSTVLAQAACLVDPSLPLICASVSDPPAELAKLGVVFTAALVKPFTTEQLDAAIGQCLRGDQGADAHRAPRREDRAA